MNVTLNTNPNSNVTSSTESSISTVNQIPNNMPNLNQDQLPNNNTEAYLSNSNNNSTKNPYNNITNQLANNQNISNSNFSSIPSNIQSKSHLIPKKSFDESDNDSNNNMQLINDLKQQQQQQLQYQQQNQQYQQQTIQNQQPTQQKQQPQQQHQLPQQQTQPKSSQFQITSISRQQSLSGNSLSNKESKESRFRIVKTDSDKKIDQSSQNTSANANQLNQQNNQTNKGDAALNNQTPNLPNRQNQNGNGAGLNGKSYHRGRWHVMDFETMENKQQIQQQPQVMPIQLQQNNYINSNNLSNNIVNQQHVGQTTPKLTNLKNYGSAEIQKNEDSNMTNYYSNQNLSNSNNFEQQSKNSGGNLVNRSSKPQQPQTIHNQQQTHFNPINSAQNYVENSNSQQNSQKQSSNVILNPKPTIPVSSNSSSNSNSNTTTAPTAITPTSNNSNHSQNNNITIPSSQYQTLNLKNNMNQISQNQSEVINQNIINQNNGNGQILSNQLAKSQTQQNMGYEGNTLMNPPQNMENIQQQQTPSSVSQSSNSSRSNSIPNGNLVGQAYPVMNQAQNQQQITPNTAESQQTNTSSNTNTSTQLSNDTSKSYTLQQKFKDDISLKNSSPSNPSQTNFIPQTMTSSLPPTVGKILGLQSSQISNSITNLDLVNNSSNNSSTNLSKFPENNEQLKTVDPSMNTNVQNSNANYNNQQQQSSPKEKHHHHQQSLQKSQQQQQTSNNLTNAVSNSTINLSNSMNSNTVSNIQSGLGGSNSSSTSTILDQTTATINELMGDSHQTDDPDDDKKADKGIKSRIELAMDLVKSHLTSAVNQEIILLKNQIKQLTEKCSRLEQDNQILKKHALPETLVLLENRGTSTQSSNSSINSNSNNGGTNNNNNNNNNNSNSNSNNNSNSTNNTTLNASASSQTLMTNGQHQTSVNNSGKLPGDVWVPKNTEISNLLISSKESQLNQLDPNRSTLQMDGNNKIPDPMVSSFNEHTGGDFHITDQTNYAITAQINDISALSSNIHNSDNTNLNLNLNNDPNNM